MRGLGLCAQGLRNADAAHNADLVMLVVLFYNFQHV